jgi:hypothetical protein
LSPIELSVNVANRGGEDALAAVVIFRAGRDRGPGAPIGSVTVDVPADATTTARLTWAPPEAGAWRVEATASPGASAAGPRALAVTAAPATGLRSVLAAQGVGDSAVRLIAVLVILAGALGGGLGFVVWSGPASAAAGSAEAGRDGE